MVWWGVSLWGGWGCAAVMYARVLLLPFFVFFFFLLALSSIKVRSAVTLWTGLASRAFVKVPVLVSPTKARGPRFFETSPNTLSHRCGGDSGCEVASALRFQLGEKAINMNNLSGLARERVVVKFVYVLPLSWGQK